MIILCVCCLPYKIANIYLKDLLIKTDSNLVTLPEPPLSASH